MCWRGVGRRAPLANTSQRLRACAVHLPREKSPRGKLTEFHIQILMFVYNTWAAEQPCDDSTKWLPRFMNGLQLLYFHYVHFYRIIAITILLRTKNNKNTNVNR